MKCLFCGCTDERACPEGCYWFVEEVCSTCAPTCAAALLLNVTRAHDKLLHKMKGAKLIDVCDRSKNALRIARLAQKQGLLPTDGELKRIARRFDTPLAEKGGR